jgi:hypothetical protein
MMAEVLMATRALVLMGLVGGPTPLMPEVPL